MDLDLDVPVSAETLADLLACNPSNVREFAARGVIQKAARGRYPLKPAVRAYVAHLRKLATVAAFWGAQRREGASVKAAAEELITHGCPFRCMIPGGSHARAEHTRSGRHRQRAPGKLSRRGAKGN
jgi:hypothetical protein